MLSYTKMQIRDFQLIEDFLFNNFIETYASLCIALIK